MIKYLQRYIFACMKPLRFLLSPVLFIVILSSCKEQQQLYGRKLIPRETDPVAAAKAIAGIKALSADGYHRYQFIGNDGAPLNYRLLSPPDTEGMHPLVIFFHGSGAVGTDNEAQLGLLAKLWLVDSIRKKYPAWVLAPQFPERSSNYVLDSSRAVLASRGSAGVATVLQLIDSLKKALPIDPRRVYVIGFSMGASTVINAVSARPELFAAAVSFAGIPEFSNLDALKKMPLWIIHGNRDEENPAASDEELYKELQPAKKLRYWEVDGTAHNDIFNHVFLGDAVPAWLFIHRR